MPRLLRALHSIVTTSKSHLTDRVQHPRQEQEKKTEVAPPATPTSIKTGKQLPDNDGEPQKAGQDVMTTTEAATETMTAIEPAPTAPAGAAAAGDNSSVVARGADPAADTSRQQSPSENGLKPPVAEPIRRGDGWAPIKAE